MDGMITAINDGLGNFVATYAEHQFALFTTMPGMPIPSVGDKIEWVQPREHPRLIVHNKTTGEEIHGYLWKAAIGEHVANALLPTRAPEFP